MNIFSVSLCLETLCLVISYQNTDALKCYFCQDCKNVDSATELDTLFGSGPCRSCVKADINGVVNRGCYATYLPEKCEIRDGDAACACNSDLCNKATVPGVKALLLFVTFVLALKMTLY